MGNCLMMCRIVGRVLFGPDGHRAFVETIKKSRKTLGDDRKRSLVSPREMRSPRRSAQIPQRKVAGNRQNDPES
jgi:hypothetical protein